jgi:hypothetical protein
LTLAIVVAQTNPKHVYVRGHTRSDGTYVKPHYRTAPNNTNRDNFSTIGNVNPYTGQAGYITPDNEPRPNYTQSSRELSYNPQDYSGWISNSYNGDSSVENRICNRSNCGNTALVHSSGYMYKKSSYCNNHSPKCSNPYCDELSLLDYFGDGYQSYCGEHEHTCDKSRCYNKALGSKSIGFSQGNDYCREHTSKCTNPNCNNPRKKNFMGDGYSSYCTDHEHTCDKSGCYNKALGNRSIGFSQGNDYCREHTLKCTLHDCSRPRAKNFMGDGYLSTCISHSR